MERFIGPCIIESGGNPYHDHETGQFTSGASFDSPEVQIIRAHGGAGRKNIVKNRDAVVARMRSAHTELKSGTSSASRKLDLTRSFAQDKVALTKYSRILKATREFK